MLLSFGLKCSDWPLAFSPYSTFLFNAHLITAMGCVSLCPPHAATATTATDGAPRNQRRCFAIISAGEEVCVVGRHQLHTRHQQDDGIPWPSILHISTYMLPCSLLFFVKSSDTDCKSTFFFCISNVASKEASFVC